MPTIVLNLMVYIGAALMVWNILGFIRFARSQQNWKEKRGLLYFPIVLLVMFLLGYLAVGIFGKPDLIISGILLGGSIFVFLMYKLLYGITRRIQDHERLEARLISAEESDQAKTAILATVSHEMRTPMNVILGLDRMALKDQTLSAETRKTLEKLLLSAQHMMDLISNMLDMNLIKAGTMRLHSEPFSLSKAVQEVSAIAETQCHEKGLRFTCVMQEEAGLQLIGDVTRLKQVLLSILDNAVKYSDPPGSVALTVTSEVADNRSKMVHFNVKDTGIGIDKSFLPQLFSTFSREDQSSTSRVGGSGLSLSVTKNIVEMMGGSIQVESEKGAGSTFTVSVPLVISADESIPEQHETAPVSLAGRKVMVVEDLPENAEIVMDLLDLEGVETVHACNGQVALDFFSESPVNHFDAILMDLRMPVMDGLTATRKIRALNREDAKTVPIIALTANAFESDVKASFDAGMNAHLAKPSDADKLYGALQKALSESLEGRRSV